MGHRPEKAIKQNSTRSLTLLRAISVAHVQAQRIQTASLGVSLLAAGLSVLAAFDRRLVPFVVIIGTVWAIVYVVLLAPAASRQLDLAATLQDMLDTELLGLPWNDVAVGDPLSTDEVHQLSRRFRGNESYLRDYYLVPDVPTPHDVYFCLEQNLAWGPRVRQRYAHLLLTVIALWCALGVAAGIALQITVGDLVSLWFVPSLGLLLLCVDVYRAQIAVTADRARALALLRSRQEQSLRERPADGGDEWVRFARQVQDVLFHSRRRQPRVPTWFFRRFHDRDLLDFRSKLNELEGRFR